MRYIFKFPDIGEGITEGKILEWLVRPGQEVREGDPLVKMETDKVVADLPSPKSGRVARLYGKAGETARVDEGLVELEIAGAAGAGEPAAEGTAAPAADGGDGAGEADVQTGVQARVAAIEEKGFGVVGQIEEAVGPAFLPATGEGFEEAMAAAPARPRKALATPVARAMARDLGVEINAVPGTGPGGRVMKEDIRRFAAESMKAVPAPRRTSAGTAPFPAPPRPEAPAAPAAAAGAEGKVAGGVTYVELTQIRKTIAARMTEAKRTIPHLTAMEKVEVSPLVALRERRKESFRKATGLNLTYLPFIIKAACAALMEHPALNSRYEPEKNRIVRHGFVHMGVAVDSPDGLIVPVIRQAHLLSVRGIAAALHDLAGRARERKLALEEIRGGTFSITNYGSIAGIYGTPIINHPEAAILGVGRIVEEPVVREGAVVPGRTMALSLAADHRIVDGAEAARFLKRVTELLADPAALLLA